MTEFERQALLAQKDFVRRIARRLVYDAQEIDDVVQDTFAAGLRQEEAPGRGWLARTVRNLAQTRARAAKRRRLREQAAARPEAEPATDEVVAKLTAAGKTLDDLKLKYYLGGEWLSFLEEDGKTKVKTTIDKKNKTGTVKFKDWVLDPPVGWEFG